MGEVERMRSSDSGNVFFAELTSREVMAVKAPVRVGLELYANVLFCDLKMRIPAFQLLQHADVAYSPFLNSLIAQCNELTGADIKLRRQLSKPYLILMNYHSAPDLYSLHSSFLSPSTSFALLTHPSSLINSAPSW